MNDVNLYILSLFDLAMIYVLIYSIFRLKKDPILKILLIILLGAVGSSLISEIIVHSVVSRTTTIVYIVLYFYLVLLRNKVKFLDYLIGMVLLLIIMYTAQITMILILTIALDGFAFTFQYGLIAQSSALIVISLLTHYLSIHKLFDYINYRNLWLKSILITSLIIFITLSYLWDLNNGTFFTSILIVAITLLIVLFVNTFVIRVSMTDKKNRDQLKIYETYLPIIDHVIDEIKIKQHDYHNQVQTIALLQSQLEGTTYDNYVKDVVSLDIWDRLILLDNKIIMAFLYSKYKEAESKGIDMSFEFKTYVLEASYTDYELVEMMGILIDNALDAAVLTDEKQVNIVMDYKDKLHKISVSNSVTSFSMSDIPKMFDFYHSSKGKGRGIGLYKLKTYLDREKGTINVFYDTPSQMLYVDICFS